MFVLSLAVDDRLHHHPLVLQRLGRRQVEVDGARHRFRVAAAEVGFQDQWQRAELGFAMVASSQRHALDIADELERFVWSRPDIEVLACDRRWLE